MKRFLPGAIALLLAVLTACGGDPLPAEPSGERENTLNSTSVTATPETTSLTPSVTTTVLPTVTTTVPDTTEKLPATTESATTAPSDTTAPLGTDAPPVTDRPPITDDEPQVDLPAMVAGLTAMDFENRQILYTVGETALTTENGSFVIRLDAGHAVVAVERTDAYDKILYRGRLCTLDAGLLTEDVPASALSLQSELGGIYYPGAGKLVAVDPGHQGKGMTAKEPLGPGSTEMKAMLSSGTAGVSTRIAERELNLRVSLLLRDELISRGYSVMMIRESHDVTLSNAQRALIANAYGADAFVRIHANGSANPDARGAMTICQTPNNPYNGDVYRESRALSDCILDRFSSQTGIKQNYVWETNTMTGINWAEIPVTIVEMGFMSNPEEDELMATDAFRKNAAVGMADGLDAYFELEIVN